MAITMNIIVNYFYEKSGHSGRQFILADFQNTSVEKCHNKEQLDEVQFQQVSRGFIYGTTAWFPKVIRMVFLLSHRKPLSERLKNVPRRFSRKISFSMTIAILNANNKLMLLDDMSQNLTVAHFHCNNTSVFANHCVKSKQTRKRDECICYALAFHLLVLEKSSSFLKYQNCKDCEIPATKIETKICAVSMWTSCDTAVGTYLVEF